MGSCALSLCYVAMGAWDGYQVDTLFCWDYSAGGLIIKEAGGVIQRDDGKKYPLLKTEFPLVTVFVTRSFLK